VVVSVIIPALNEERWLPFLLDDLCRQTSTDIEVIVADAFSSDRTRQIALSRGCRVVDGGLPGQGRNAGARVARGELLLFLDADVRIGEEFLDRAVREFRARRLGAATCTFLPDARERGAAFLYGVYNLLIRSAEAVWPTVSGGAMLLVSRDLFRGVGGYDDSLKITEDKDIIRRIARRSRFRVLDTVSCQVSVRRIRSEKPLTFVTKILFTQVLVQLRGRISSHTVVRYDFSHADAPFPAPRSPRGPRPGSS
jgi:glycosyltransferase involved in cell wall biosynthesis